MTKLISALIVGQKAIHSNKTDKDYHINYVIYHDGETVGRCAGQFVSEKGKYGMDSLIKVCINKGSLEPVEIDLDSDDLMIPDQKGGKNNG